MTYAGRAAGLAALTGVAAGLGGALLPLPMLAAASAAALAALLLLALIGCGYRPFWYALLALWLGYAMLGKGFAYVGTEVAHVGEVVLAIGIASLVLGALRGRLAPALARPPAELWLLAAFLAWQAARTVPYVSVYGVDALRDGALWGYAAFAIAVFLIVPGGAIDAALAACGRLAPFFLAALLAAFVAGKLNLLQLTFPGSPSPLGALKGGDIGVNLAGLGALLLLAPIVGVPSNEVRWPLASWPLWCCTFIAVASGGRAAGLAAASGVAIAAAFAPKRRWRPLVAGAIVVAGAATLFELRAATRRGEISTRQVVVSFTSIFSDEKGDSSAVSRQRTKEWRLAWWRDIVGYTVGGKYRWLGKGYGINLAADDRYLVGNRTLRSPHNASMTILARSGVPGLALWLAFLAALLVRLLRRALPGAPGAPEDRRFAAWALAFLAAYLVNSSFDVFLEGPVGGIPFWSLIGLCWVKLRDDRRTAGADLPVSR